MMAKRPIKPAVEQPNPSTTTTNISTSEDQQQQAQQQQQRGGAGGGGSGGGGAGAGGAGAGGQDTASADVDTLSPTTPVPNKKRRAAKQPAAASGASSLAGPSTGAKRTRTNTPWTAAEEQRLKSMRDAGNSWSEIAKTFPTRTEGSVKKHWYKASLELTHYLPPPCSFYTAPLHLCRFSSLLYRYTYIRICIYIIPQILAFYATRGIR